MNVQATDLDEKRLQVLRRMGSVGRLRAAFGLFDFAREHLTVNLRARHPEWTEEQVRKAVRERLMASP
jgi:hypothetical protein